MNLEELRTVQADERESDGIQPLPDSFYRDVTAYLEEIREERAELLQDTQDLYGSEEVRQLTHEIETAQEVAEAIYDRRLAKIVKHASLAAAGMTTEETGLTEEEKALYNDLVSRIEDQRELMLDRFAGRANDTQVSDTGTTSDQLLRSTPDREPDSALDELDTELEQEDSEPTSNDRERPNDEEDFDASDTMGSESTPSMGGSQETGSVNDSNDESVPDSSEHAHASHTEDEALEGSSSGDSDEHTTNSEDSSLNTSDASIEKEAEMLREEFDGEYIPIRITQDIGEIMGVDERVYHLAAGDVMMLPSENANPLIERDAAERIE